MSAFTCVVNPRRGAACSDQSSYAGPMGANWGTQLFRNSAITLYARCTELGDRPHVAVNNQFALCGDLFLQDRRPLQQLVPEHRQAPDHELVLAALTKYGADRVSTIVGEFALVLVSLATPDVLLLRDALGVQPLYYKQFDSYLAASSRAALLSTGSKYDLEFIADYLADGWSAEGRTIYSDVRSVPPAQVIRVTEREIKRDVFWSPGSLKTDYRISFADACSEFRRLLFEAVRISLTGSAAVWSSLSGGVDSSSIVAVAHRLKQTGNLENGLAGTLSYYDDVGRADERRFSELVSQSTTVVNETFRVGWPWKDFDGTSPLPDSPVPAYLVTAMYDEMVKRLHRHGARVYLLGVGPDHLMGPELSYISDLVGTGHVVRGLREAWRWAVGHERSIWSVLWTHGTYPLLPSSLRAKYGRRSARPRAWLNPKFVREYDLLGRLAATRRYDVRPGQKYVSSVACELDGLRHNLNPKLLEDRVGERYPYLYRPLVEFICKLPPEFRMQPDGYKYVMREALKGVLPEAIRTRTDKGTGGARIHWAFAHEAEKLEFLLREPILADLGCVDLPTLRRRVARVQSGKSGSGVRLLHTLALETWLSVRAGRWVSWPNRSRTLASA